VTPTAPVAPRVLVFVQETARSIQTTGRLERNGVGTLRCWTLADVQRALREAKGLLGAALVDLCSPDGQSAVAAVASGLPGLPIIVWRDRMTYSLMEQSQDAFAARVLEVLS